MVGVRRCARGKCMQRVANRIVMVVWGKCMQRVANRVKVALGGSFAALC